MINYENFYKTGNYFIRRIRDDKCSDECSEVISQIASGEPVAFYELKPGSGKTEDKVVFLHFGRICTCTLQQFAENFEYAEDGEAIYEQFVQAKMHEAFYLKNEIEKAAGEFASAENVFEIKRLSMAQADEKESETVVHKAAESVISTEATEAESSLMVGDRINVVREFAAGVAEKRNRLSEMTAQLKDTAAFISNGNVGAIHLKPCFGSGAEMNDFVNRTTGREIGTETDRNGDFYAATNEKPVVVDLQMSLKISEFLRQSLNRAGRAGRIENITVRLTADAMFVDASIYNTKTGGLLFYSNAWSNCCRDDYFREMTKTGRFCPRSGILARYALVCRRFQ